MLSYIKLKRILPALTITLLFGACNKQDALQSDTSTSISWTIAVAASLSLDSVKGSVTDSVYLLQPCRQGAVRDSIAQSDLPASITSYLTANYSSYTFNRAYAIKSNTVITGYVAVIYFNDKPVGLEFDVNGSFTKVLEQRENGDPNGRGGHDGGRFAGRGHPSLDTVSLSALPEAITQYLMDNYSEDTLLKAYINRTSSYAILSQNNGLFATVFSGDGSFITRAELTQKRGSCNAVAEADLPAAILSYLDTSYPGYVLKKAYAQQVNGAVEGYVVLIDANTTTYALQFDAAGTFIRLKTIT